MSKVYRFGDFRLDCGSYELLRNGHPIKLERKPMALLVLFASREGQLVTRAEIAERLWSSEVFVDTEHGINTAVRKLRFELRDDPVDPKFIKTITGVGYRFVAPVFAEPAPSLSEPEASPSSVVPTAPDGPALANLSGADSTSPPRSRRFLWLLVVPATVVLVLIVSLELVRLRQRSAPPVIRSLAVIPLDNFSGDPGQDYLADGMTDELITMIARNSTLRITSRTSVMQYKGVHRPLSEIAHSLGVDGIVEGSIARKGDQVHMTLQLIRADTDSHIWAQSFNRAISDTALAEEAARTISERLHSATPIAATRRYVNPVAHDAYLRGKYLWFSQNMQDSGAYFRRATEIQPDYAEAWAGLANYYAEGAAEDVLDPRTAFGPQEAAAKRALELAPDLAEAHLAMAAVYLIARWDLTNADLESQRAISLDPHDGESYYFRACVLDAMDRHVEAIEAAKRSVELAPYQRPSALAEMYFLDRQYDAALSEVRLRLEAQPNNVSLLFVQSDTWRRKGNYKEAMDAWQRMLVASGDAETARQARLAYEKGGWHGFIRWQIRLREGQAKGSYVSPVELANYQAQLGERDQTLALLEEGYRQRATDMRWIHQDPAYDFLSTEPRFRSILNNVGSPAH